jgi:hypothetical protein
MSLILTGTLRQFGSSEFEGKKKTKLWLEHTSERDNGPADLKLEELFLEGDLTSAMPSAGSQISIIVRPYVVGKGVKFAAVGLAAKTAAPSGPLKS